MFSIVKNNKNKLNNKRRVKESAVSLISLIVTIIVLLILASIAIKISSGDAGVIKKAKKSASIYENTSEDESETMDDYARKLKKFVKAPRAENIEFKADITEWTTNDVTVTATSDDPDCEIELKSEDSDWSVRKDNKITVSRNQQINARLKNLIDKYSEDVATYNVTNIDRLAPTNTAPTATATTNSITVTNKQTDSGSGIVSIQYQIKKKGNSTWEPLQSSAIFSGLIQNTEYNIRTHAVDKVGNSSDSLETTIKTKSLAEVGVATASPTSLTSGDVTVTLPTEKNLTTLYTTDGSIPTLSSTKYTNPFTVSSNCTVTFIYTDGNNVNSAGTIKISNIDKTIYKITYNLNGGTANNPDTYKVDTDTITLSNPTKEKNIFVGWTGSNGNTPQTEVKINKGSSGDKSFTANWTPEPYKLSISDTSNYGTFDVYVDGNPVQTGLTSCNVDVGYGQKYEIKVSCLSGIVCDSTDLSGTMSDNVTKTLTFSRAPVNLDYYSFNTSIKRWLNDTEYSISGESTALIDNNVKNIIFYANVVAPSGTILKMGDVDVYGTLSNGELKLQTRGSHYVMPEDYSKMFRSFYALTSINYNNCVDLSKIRVAEKTFENCKSLGDVNISSLFGENVTNLSECFISSGVKSVTFGKLNNAVNLFKTFTDCKNLSNFTVVDGAVIKPTIMEGTFISCTALRSFTFAANKWDFSQVSTFTSLFQDASNLTSVNIEVQQKGISNKNISYNSMFNRCTNITSITLNFGSAPNAGANCRAMFQGCEKLQTLNMGNSNIGTIYNGSFMFNDCYSIQYINLLGHAKQISGYPNATTDMDGASLNSMFADCRSLRRIFFNQPTDIVVAYYATGESMFVNDSKLEGFINGSNATFNSRFHTSDNLSSIYAKNTDSPRSGVAGTGGFFWTSGAHN